MTKSRGHVTEVERAGWSFSCDKKRPIKSGHQGHETPTFRVIKGQGVRARLIICRACATRYQMAAIRRADGR
jgi:hypothetical protein